MITLAASLLLASLSPSAADQAAHFVQVQSAAPSEQPTQRYEGWTKAQLIDERIRLELERPGLGIPISFLASGGAFAVVDAAILLWGGFFALFGNSFSVGTIVVMIVFAVIAASGIITGLALLFPALHRRSAMGEQIDEVNRAIDAPPPGRPMPPFEAPPPLQVRRPAPWLTVVVARF